MKENKNYEKLVKTLQIAAIVFMLAMLITMLIVMNKFDISIENAAELSKYITGGTLTVALIIIAFTVVKFLCTRISSCGNFCRIRSYY